MAKLVEYLAMNTGVVPTVLVFCLAIGFGIYVYFDSKYKNKLESNHFATIDHRFDEIERMVNSNHESTEKKFNAAFLKIDELRSYGVEFSKEMFGLKTQFAERTKAMQDNIDRLNKKIFNGFRED